MGCGPLARFFTSMFGTDKSVSRMLWGLLAVVLALSALYSFYYHDRPRVDASAYDKIGWNLARGLGYVEDEAKAGDPKSDEAIIRVGPGYELFLAGGYSVFGHSIPAIWVLHAVLRAASALLVFGIAILVFPGKSMIALGAAAIFGFTPDLVVINGLLLSETLFIFFLLAAAYFSLRSFAHQASGTQVFSAGLFWALAILTRPVALLPFGMLILYFLWSRELRRAFLLFVCPLVLVGSWSYYASMRYDSFILTTTVGGYDLWVGNNPYAKGGFEKTPEIQEARQRYASVELDKIGKRKYFAYLASDPVGFAELQLRKAALYFSALRPGGYWVHLMGRPRHLKATLAASFAATLFLFVGGIAGAWRFFKERKDAAGRLFLAFAFLQPIAVIPIIVETRYRYAFFPFLAIFAAYFFSRRPLWARALLGAALVVMFFTAYDAFRNWPEIIGKISRVL